MWPFKKKFNAVKFLGRTLVVAVIAAIVLLLAKWITEVITRIAGSFGIFVSLVFVLVFATLGMKIRKGKEDAIETILSMVSVLAVFAFLAAMGVRQLEFIVDMTLPGILLAFTSVWLGEAVTSNIKMLKQ